MVSGFKEHDYIKRWSWQKMNVIGHFTKMCAYELKDANPHNPPSINYKNLSEIRQAASYTKNFKLLNHINMVEEYYKDSHQGVVNFKSGRVASMTSIKGGIYIFDYDFSLFAPSDECPLPAFVSDISQHFAQHNIDLSGADFILKACLE